jgi:phosphatidylglycerol:prolipoprotein diacylglycerol transferase
MYLVAFLGCWWAAKIKAARPNSGWKQEEIGDLLFYVALGVVLGGRLGYMLFYGWANIVADPLSVLRVWEGGMSFHGGLIGVLIAMGLYARHTSRSFFNVADLVAPVVPIGLGAGRMGNFINGELWGHVTDLPWGMVFPTGGPEPRHPSMLYELFLEGIVMFVVLWVYSSKPRPAMAVTGLFGLLYGVFRFAVEFVREPDAHLGYLAFGWVTMGQVLSLPMILIGAAMMWLAYARAAKN